MATKSIKINILIVEDHSLTRFGLKTAIETQDYLGNIYEAENGANAISIFTEHKPDIVLLDLGLPDIDGIKIAKKIKAIDKHVKIIILTSHNNHEEVWEALSAGANAYCLKDIEPDRLLKVIEYVYEGAAWLDPGIAEIVLKGIQKSEMTQDTQKDHTAKQIVELTEREKEVLRLIVDGLNNADISKKLCVSIHTAKAHVCSILQKLSVDDRTQAAIKALKDGIV